MTTPAAELDWIKVGTTADLPEGRVKSVTARTKTLCLSHFNGQWAAMDNRCPHQGGPLGEGSIEKGNGRPVLDPLSRGMAGISIR